MGSARIRPEQLARKLQAVREKFGYSFAEMAAKLSDDLITVNRQDVHRYENDLMAPSIIVLLRYSRLARVKMEIFADDKLDLPW